MFKTLRAKLLAFFLLITFTPLIFIGYISYQSQKLEITRHIEQALLMYSNSLSIEIEKLLEERINDLHYLTKNPLFNKENVSESEIEELFEHFVQIYHIYSDTIYLDTNGKVLVSLIDHVIGKDLSDRLWFQASSKGETYISDIYYSKVINRPILVMSAPVLNDLGEVTGIVSPSFDLNYLWNTFNRFSEQEHIVGLDGYAFLINKNGDFIAHPDYEKILKVNHLNDVNLITADVFEKSINRNIYYNEDAVLAYAKIKKIEGFDHDWFVGISVSKDPLFQPLKELLNNFLLVMSLVLFLTTIAVVNLSNFIVRPVEQLVAATIEFSIGKPLTPRFKNSYEEINRLNETFMIMTQKLAERELGHKKSTLILEKTDNGVMAINKKTKQITLFNPMAERLFKLPKEDALYSTIDQLSKQSSPFKKFVHSAKIMEKLLSNESMKFELQCEIDEKISYFFVSITSLPSLEKNESEELLIVINDLTEKRRMEFELIRSEKLKVVGEMSAGLAHEIRNPLAIIRGFIQLFRQDELGAKKDYYDLIIKEIDRVNHFITDLLNIANPKSKGETKELNVVKLLEDLLKLQNSQLSNKGIILIKILNHVPNVVADASKLQQVFINMIQNAVEAMQSGDTLKICTYHDKLNNQVQVHIEDTGIGMDQQTVKKLGTPFYTTKEKGTGLGLATSFRIVEELGGTIQISSALQKGTVFIINIPLEKNKD